MKKSHLLRGAATACLFSAAALSGPAVTADTPDAPDTEAMNILFIFMEDMGIEINPYGDYTAPTPALTELAGSSMLFENAYVTHPTCSPSRASILTGVYPHQHGQMGLAQVGGFSLRPGLETFPRMLKEAGYYNGISYKIHVDPESRTSDYIDHHYDFQRFRDDGYNTAHYGQALNYFDEFLENRPDGAPFFYMAQTADTHRTFEREGVPEAYEAAGDPYLRIQPDEVRPLPSFGHDITMTDHLAQDVANYYNAIQRVDLFVSGLMERVEAAGLADNTLIVFSSDHGPAYGRGKCALHEFGTKVPLMVRWPGAPSDGQRTKALVSLLDLMPTFLEAAGVPEPDYLEGRSLRPLLHREQTQWREYLFTEYIAHWPIQQYFPMRAVRDSRYKLIHNLLADKPELLYDHPWNEGIHAEGCPDIWAAKQTPEGTVARSTYERFFRPPVFELYDLHVDPHEHHNLAEEPEYAEIRERLTASLLEWREATDDPFLDADYTERFSRHYSDHLRTIREWEEENPGKPAWKYNYDIIRADWSEFTSEPWDK